jgi:hypothetical protein
VSPILKTYVRGVRLFVCLLLVLSCTSLLADALNTGGCENTKYYMGLDDEHHACEYLQCDLTGGEVTPSGELICNYGCEWKKYALKPGCPVG